MIKRLMLFLVLVTSSGIYSQTIQVTGISWTNIVDNDNDGYTLSRTLNFSTSISEGQQNIKVYAYYQIINYENWLEGPKSDPVMVQTNSSTPISIEFSEILFNPGIVNIRLEFHDTDNPDTILFTAEPELYSELQYQLFEGNAYDTIDNGQTYIVTNTNNDGTGSLRTMLTTALIESPDHFNIYFNIPPSDENYNANRETWTIKLDTPLPNIQDTGDLSINGLSQPLYSKNGVGIPIVIDGSNLTAGSGINITRSVLVFIQGLQVLNFRDYGFEFDQAGEGFIDRCIVGTDPSMYPDIQMKAGFYFFNMKNMDIGYPVYAGDDLIAGNYFVGNIDIGALLFLCSDIQIINNYFGIADYLDSFFPPTHIDVAIQAQNNSSDIEIMHNRFADEGNIAIQLLTGQNCTISKNSINTDSTWSKKFGDYKEGIKLIAQSSDDTVSQNVIGYCSGAAITLDSDQNRNLLSQNSISKNGSGIEFPEGMGITADLDRVENNELFGLAGPGFTIEVFGDEDDQARHYLGTTTVNNGMEFSYNLENLPTYPFLTATVTDQNGNTGYISDPLFWVEPKVNNPVVTNTNNDGEGSLRAALQIASESTDPDTIRFNLSWVDSGYHPDTETWEINLLSMLAISTDNLVIDGSSQAEYVAEDRNPYGPEIVINGSQASAGNGLYFLNCDSITIQDITVTNFASNISLSGVTNANIQNCYIGTDQTGQAAGETSNDGLTAYLCQKLEIGSDNPELGNIISGNQSSGVIIDSCTQVRIKNNKIGIDRTGTSALANEFESVLVQDGSQNVELSNNHIAGKVFGVRLITAENITIANNIINTDSTITQDLGDGAGIILQQESSNNLIDMNTIAFSDRAVVIADSSINNRLNQNIITGNNQGVILTSGGNHELLPPVLATATSERVDGTAGPGQSIQLFADDTNQGAQYLGETIADNSGVFSLALSSPPDYEWITAIATDSSGNSSSFSSAIKWETTDVENDGSKIVEKFHVSANYPNPFNPITRFKVALPNDEHLEIKIYNVLGEHVITLYDNTCSTGVHQFAWNGKDKYGLAQTSGAYFIRVQSESGIAVRKILYMK